MCLSQQDAVGSEVMGLPVAEESDASDDIGGAHGEVAAAPMKRRRMSSSERLAVRFFKELEALLGCLTPDLLRALHPTEVAVFLGSTPLRPKEIFSFTLDEAFSASYQPQDSTTDVKHAEKLIGNAARRLIRDCLPSVASCPPSSAAMKVFLMVKAPAGGAGEGGSGGAEWGVAEPPVGFLPKRGFVPLLRQTKVKVDFTVLVKRDGGGSGDSEGSGGSGDSGDARATTEEAAADDDPLTRESLWYQCTSSVKGLKGAGAY